LRLFNHIAHLVVPTQAELHGHRNLRHRPSSSPRDAANALRLAAERRADALVREVVDRTAAIEIDEIGASRLDERGRPSNFLRVGAGQLHAEEWLASNLRINANSALRRCFSRLATVISLIVTRAPSSTHKRRYGRFEPLVIGAMTTAPVSTSRRSIDSG
jgi:hypothetical protein